MTPEPAGGGRGVRRFVLCADDFGMSPAADASILHLAGMGRVTAVSCLVDGPAWRADAPALVRPPGGAETGLHLTFGDEHPAGIAWRADAPALVRPPGGAETGLHLTFGDEHPAAIAWRAARGLAGLAGSRTLEARIEAQLDAFAAALGRPPAYVDGHLHVHQVPGVREALLRVLRRRHGDALPWIRNTVPLRARGAKAAVVAALGGHGLLAALRRGGVRHNADFAGVYDFDPRADYRALLQGWLADVADGGLVLCHPVAPDREAGTPDAVARQAEARHLASDAFLDDCRAAGATPGLPADVLPPAGAVPPASEDGRA